MITSETFGKAVIFAANAHKGQFRKGDGRPYILHPISVMSRIGKAKKSVNIYLLGASALLHDTVEDCGISIEQIAQEFGYHVAALVQELTLDKRMYELVGKSKYLASEMLKMSSYGLAIKLCDRLDNVSDMKKMPSSFVRNYIRETEYILDRLPERKLTGTHKKLIRKIEKKLLNCKNILQPKKK